MTIEQIRKLIAQENDNRRHEAEHTAHQLIQRIADLQQAKVDTDLMIAEAREELHKLSSKTVDEADIIGGF